MTASEIIQKYIAFFEKRGHKKIANSPLVPLNDPTTLFTSSGMQPLVPYLLGEAHPEGTRLVDVQNCFRAVDIDEAGDNRHTTFFRMLGNWSLGDYFKKEQIPWMWEFVTKELGIAKEKLYVTVFEGGSDIPRDKESANIWKHIFEKEGLNPDEKIFYYGAKKNWWSRAGTPSQMPAGEPGGTTTEMFYGFDEIQHDPKFGKTCHPNCDCGKFFEIGNGVFMQFKKTDKGLDELPKKNVDFGGGLERLVAASENQNDFFQTSLFAPIIQTVEQTTGKQYEENRREMRIITDHFISAIFIIANGIAPSNKDQGYILRRLIRRGLDNFYELKGTAIAPVLEKIVEEYEKTDPYLTEQFEKIKDTILEEQQKYENAMHQAKSFIAKRYRKQGDELMGTTEISADDAFTLYTTHGLSPTQIKSLGYSFDEQQFAKSMEEHQKLSRTGAAKKFAGGLADHSEKTIMGHTATHLLHKTLRDLLGETVHQTGSNITSDRVRFDFNFERKLTDEEIKKVEQSVNEKIEQNLPVFWEIMPLARAKKLGAIGLFGEKYENMVKIYWIGGSKETPEQAYSKEFCGGPHVEFTGALKRFTIIKQENIGNSQKRLYAKVGL